MALLLCPSAVTFSVVQTFDPSTKRVDGADWLAGMHGLIILKLNMSYTPLETQIFRKRSCPGNTCSASESCPFPAQCRNWARAQGYTETDSFLKSLLLIYLYEDSSSFPAESRGIAVSLCKGNWTFRLHLHPLSTKPKTTPALWPSKPTSLQDSFYWY